MKISNKKKFVRSMLVMVGVVIAVNFVLISKVSSSVEVKCKSIAVVSGDTLWDIASDEVKNNEYYKGKDVRYVMSHIKDVNGLKSSDLSVNQELKIPTY